ncbi:tRNA(Arg) A34 adenosine deaminase TadA [Pullulanibacillus pueri]|uniref:tRNA-specific adenosine deaminase n=1 Tax=Pullulanibacillus pueri TaxID=1437324 RepID=A0A8J2ZUE9_9BACL|nr:nucleoside deaminase [Pullulanibacillus pueri]MBM7681341.1 tRNA(Arg) A34 adenosine deaminase TadA [Pullulanibacillus pueri]GGH77527.1 tRNA-specific adenosine deaminase [Pullulanibacillus pueri]
MKGDELIATGVNRVTDDCDPTAHAEVMAIRAACQKLKTFDLSGCTLYTSCEPCPMCLGAIYWARLDAVYYAANRVDAAHADFDDDFIYQEVPISPEKRSLPFIHLPLDNAIEPFALWGSLTNKVPY